MKKSMMTLMVMVLVGVFAGATEITIAGELPVPDPDPDPLPSNSPWLVNSAIYSNPLDKNIGIGTPGPKGRLGIEVTSSIRNWLSLQNPGVTTAWKLYSPTTSDRLQFNFQVDPATTRWSVMNLFETGAVGINTDQARGRLNIKASTEDWMALSKHDGDGFWKLHRSGDDRMTFAYDNGAGSYLWDILEIDTAGRVGINGALDSGATADFNVEGHSNFNGRVRVEQGWGDWLTLGNEQDSAEWHIHNPQNQDRITFGHTDAQGTTTWSLFSILENGNVAIGSSSAPEKLSVDGTILAEEIRVKMSQDWPDYVFSEDYDLASLDEVENYIAEHKHLPGVPAAEAVQDEHVGLGEMNRVMMEKIEELTLHMIDLKNENRDLARQIDEMKSE